MLDKDLFQALKELAKDDPKKSKKIAAIELCVSTATQLAQNIKESQFDEAIKLIEKYEQEARDLMKPVFPSGGVFMEFKKD